MDKPRYKLWEERWDWVGCIFISFVYQDCCLGYWYFKLGVENQTNEMRSHPLHSDEQVISNFCRFTGNVNASYQWQRPWVDKSSYMLGIGLVYARVRASYGPCHTTDKSRSSLTRIRSVETGVRVKGAVFRHVSECNINVCNSKRNEGQHEYTVPYLLIIYLLFLFYRKRPAQKKKL